MVLVRAAGLGQRCPPAALLQAGLSWFCLLCGLSVSRTRLRSGPQDPAKQRHLLRLWIAPPEERPLPDAYLEIMGGSTEVGKRGGIVPERRPYVPLEPTA